MSNFSEYYNKFYKELAKIDEKGNTFSKIRDMLPKLSKDAQIIDIGCGHGSVSEELVKGGYEVFGVEINNEAIESLKGKGFHVIKHDINEPFNFNKKFDLVLLLDVLEHTFDPVALLEQSIGILNENGELIISIPLYFDLRDRIRILFTGSIISYDNLCYGKKNYNLFKSYNYDHIRFFRPKEILNLLYELNLQIVEVKYVPIIFFNPVIKNIMRIFINRFTSCWFPSLLAHSMKIRVKKST